MFNTVKAFADAYGRRDMNACLDCFKSSGDVVVFGTAADEKRIGSAEIRTQMERDWAQSESARMEITWHKAVSRGDTGWVAADFMFKYKTAKEEGEFLARATFVLEKDPARRWVITHMHISRPDPGTPEGRSFN